MKIEHLGIESRDHGPRYQPLRCTTGLNVVDATVSESSRHLADLVGHVLYGARLDRHESVVVDPAGYVDVASSLGRFRLERHSDRANRGTFTEPRLTVAPLDGQHARPHTTRDLLAGMSPEIASRLMVLRSTDDSQLEWLLSESLAAEMCRIEQAPHGSPDRAHRSTASDEQFAARDRLSHQIELLLAEKRRSSEALEATLADLGQQAASTEHQLAGHRRDLEGVVSELAEIETQLRYHELAEFVGRTSDEAYHSDQRPALTALDEEIAKWRRALAELEARGADVRRQLAQMHPDDSSPWLPLADQKACVTIAQRLVADLDSEVARYARPGDSQACLCQNTHARLHPLVDTLGKQVEKLTRLVEQYETAIEIEQLKAEAQHLDRSQGELRATIEHLLDRRQSRLRTSRVRSTVAAANELPADCQRRLAALQERRDELSSVVAAGQRKMAELTARRDRLHRDRAELMNDQALRSLREQLDEVTRSIEFGASPAHQTAHSAAPWRASDILAKLTDGRLREVRLLDHGRRATVVNRHGTPIAHADLEEVDRRLLAVSLQLAAVAGAGQWGLELPLLVVDPFAPLPAAQAAILALLLHDFASSGRQVLLVTTSRAAIDRLRAVGQPILAMQHAEPMQPTKPAPQVALEILDKADPQPAKTITLHANDFFALGLEDPIERFRVFGDDTAQVFNAIGIRTIGEFLDAEAEALSTAMDRTGISHPIVELWQIHVAMLVYVPNLTLDGAQLLTGAGIENIDQLASSDAEHLYRSICEYLDSPRGVRHRSQRAGIDVGQVQTWIADARRERDRWQSSRYARRSQKRTRHQDSPRRSSRGGTTNGKRPNADRKRKRPLKFRLSRTSPVVDAPSIGPKTAKRLAKVGVATVDELLTADAGELAASLRMKHITAETVVAWQHQAQLMCRVPELLVRDTQILVGCGFATPEDIAAAEVADLYEFAKSYTSTAEGTRVLRGSDPPDLARATKWVFWAGHRRAMEAA